MYHKYLCEMNYRIVYVLSFRARYNTYINISLSFLVVHSVTKTGL